MQMMVLKELFQARRGRKLYCNVLNIAIFVISTNLVLFVIEWSAETKLTKRVSNSQEETHLQKKTEYDCYMLLFFLYLVMPLVYRSYL